MSDRHLVNMGLAICTPIPYVMGPNGPRRSMVTIEWHRARSTLMFPTNFNHFGITCDGMEVGDARNAAVDLAMKHDPKPLFLLFHDYDVIPLYDAFTKLFYRAKHFPDYDIFAGVYCSKTDSPDPLIYKGDGTGPFWDWAIGDLITEGVTGVHMGMTLIRMSLFDRMKWSDENPLFKTTHETVAGPEGLSTCRGTEDLFFCRRAVEEYGAKILVDTSVLCGHIDHASGRVYGLPEDCTPVMRAKWMAREKTGENGKTTNVAPDAEGDKKIALDIGFGGHDRSKDYPGYKVYTTDIRADTKPDYVVDTRLLNLPSDHFDQVMSSHHLEHIGRWDQEAVWKEIFRITKPGGKIEHIVPNTQWAAAKIQDSQEDEHVHNVLYGAQEAHGYNRIYNTHFFGYTPQNAKGLAERSGFVDVVITTYKDRPELGYNLVIMGRKPKETDKAKHDGNGQVQAPNWDGPEPPHEEFVAVDHRLGMNGKDQLVATGFGFSEVPSGAAVDGVKVQLVKGEQSPAEMAS